MERFPLLVYIGAAILAYTAGSMVTHEKNFTPFFENNPFFTASIPFLFTITVLLVGIFVNQVKLRNT
jgi:predicted tellurium resistance membrane protein TerC